MQENSESPPTSPANTDTTPTTEQSMDQVSNDSSSIDANKEFTKPAEEPPQQPSPPPTTNTDNTVTTDSNIRTRTVSDSSATPTANPQAKPSSMKRYHSFSSADPRSSVTEGVSSSFLGLETLERHEGHLHRKHEMDSATKRASSR